ncbi:AMP-binding protein [Sphingosinicella rhizophila]|uniref:AMP-binding protein n=1 Tax=Sphingosinicella rhizophila TaxID=3050082 RepID=A0ABU3Q4I3_9SPHN|nr:AMP-binding protein [Sphingosinicella sp. GR2756]MDT9598328.1 AMP-binding protein [Sphingosinicella sp. GR2756]
MTTAHIDTFVRDRLPPPDQQPDFLFDLPELQYPRKLNAAVELIDKADPGRLAVINDAGSWTYGEMKDLSDRIARLLAEEEGLVPGNRVFLRGPNNAMMFAAWLGILKAGGIAVATMPILRPGEIATIIERADIRHAIVDARTLDDFTKAASTTGRIGSLLTYEGDAGGGMLETRLASVQPGFAAVDTERDDVALLAFTSGTTGKPKGCIHFHRDILAPADAFARHILAPQTGERWACSAPIAFTFGLGQQLIFPFRFGGTAVTIEAPTPPALVAAIEKFEVTTLGTAPTAYKAILSQLEGRDISSLRTCVSAGEHLPAATWHAWKEATGIAIVDGIGATEMMHIFISARGDDIRPGATGKAVPGYRACVLDADDRPLPHGVGRLAIKGPTGCRYFDDDRQANYVVKGWNVTGDTYRADEEGYFWYVARSDDMIISSGYNIAAPEVENALYSHEAVQECAVIGVPCEERGQKVKAFVVLAPGQTAGPALAESLQNHVKAVIAPYKYPRLVEFVEALPKTATGKLQRYALRP